MIISLMNRPLRIASRGWQTARPVCHVRHVSKESAASSTTHFGYKTVKSEDKESLVGGVFSSVASSYDVMNDAMSLGIHRLWKDRFVDKLLGNGPSQPRVEVLDVAGGTGDIAKRLIEKALGRGQECHVHVVDINADMLAEGEKRFMSLGKDYTERSRFSVGNAQELAGIEDDSLDLYTIAFGIRNVTRIDLALEQAHRVLRKGGIFSCLEFSQVRPALLQSLYKAYSFSVIPNLGHIIAGDRDSYQYLVESIQRFPKQQDFAKMIQAAGFVMAEPAWEDLTFGVAAIHTGIKL